MIRLLTTSFLVTLTLVSHSTTAVQIGAEALLPEDPRQVHARYVRFRPADGQVVSVNPPRISWPYLKEINFDDGAVPANRLFDLQIADNREFRKPAVDIRGTPYNFFNFLPLLDGSRTWYWRVGYNVPGKAFEWSDIRSFTVADGAVEWDRSHYGELIENLSGHPRILFNDDNRSAMLALQENNPLSQAYAREIVAKADAFLDSRYFRNFPQTDDKSINYMPFSDALVHMGFAYLLTGDRKYEVFKKLALTMASWPPGGKSSPEGKGQSLKWQTHVTEHLGFLYDWFYDEWTTSERAIIKNSIEWRLRWTLNDFAWKQKGGTVINRGSIAASCGSHPYQNIMAILPGALAICDESEIAREVLECGLHYITGISNAHGEDEAWHDGPGYGNGKMKWLTNATWCLQSAIPQLELGRNPAYSAYMDFFARITPVGAEHSSFGNRGVNELDWTSSRIMNSIRVAMLCNDGTAYYNWINSRRRMEDLGKTGMFSQSPYIDYVMPLYGKLPRPLPESDLVGLFESEGWITVSSASPGDYASQKNAVSMAFACRPRGGFNHSFRNENAFDIHAYGETIATGGGSTSNQSDFANDSMSHNTVLVNGLEQAAAMDRNAASCGRIIAFKRGEDYVYWAGNATPAYEADSGLRNFTRHVLFVDSAYFVIFDELEMQPDEKPASFQWLYHVPSPDLLHIHTDQVVDYTIGATRVRLQHIAPEDTIRLDYFSRGDGMRNPITGKDYRVPNEGQLREVSRKISFGNVDAALPPAADVEHLWFSNRKPMGKMHFFVVIAPYKENESAPVIKSSGDTSVTVSFQGKSRKIAFASDPSADISVIVEDL